MLHPRLLYTVVLILLFTSDAEAQTGAWNNVKKGKERPAKTVSEVKKWKDHLQQWGLDSNYNHELAIGGRLNTNGWTGLVCYQKRLSRTQSQFLQLAFSEVIHEKQVKQQRENKAYPELGSPTPFVFGKMNNLYTLQLGYGREKLLLPGIMEGNISVSLRLQGGISMAMLKPYYLKLVYTDDTLGESAVFEQKYTDQNSEKFLTASSVLGASKWSKGLNEIKYVPGAFIAVAFVIETIKNKNFIKSITLGSNLAFYTKRLLVMADQKAYNYQACLYIGLSLGKRWR